MIKLSLMALMTVGMMSLSQATQQFVPQGGSYAPGGGQYLGAPAAGANEPYAGQASGAPRPGVLAPDGGQFLGAPQGGGQMEMVPNYGNMQMYLMTPPSAPAPEMQFMPNQGMNAPQGAAQSYVPEAFAPPAAMGMQGDAAMANSAGMGYQADMGVQQPPQQQAYPYGYGPATQPAQQVPQPDYMAPPMSAPPVMQQGYVPVPAVPPAAQGGFFSQVQPSRP